MQLRLACVMLLGSVNASFGTEVIALRLMCHPVADARIAEIAASNTTDEVFVDDRLVARWAMLTVDPPNEDVVVRSVAGNKQALVLIGRLDVETVDVRLVRASGTVLTITMSSKHSSQKLGTLTRREHNRRLAVIVDGVIVSIKQIVSQIPSAGFAEIDLEDKRVAFLSALAINRGIAIDGSREAVE